MYCPKNLWRYRLMKNFQGHFTNIRRLAGIFIFTLMPFSTAGAQAQTGSYNWSGFYLGGHVGYGRGHVDVSLQDPVSTRSGSSFGSLFGGAQVGYNYLLPSHILIGAETDISFPNSYPSDAEVWTGTTPRSMLVEQLDYIATLRGRFGYVFDNTLLYATGGLALSNGHFVRTDPATGDEQSLSGLRTSWTAGAGVEVAFWSAP